MPRRYPQASIMMYPKTEKLLEQAMAATGKHKAAVMREATDLGLQQLISGTKCPNSPRSLTEADLSDIRAIIQEEISQC